MRPAPVLVLVAVLLVACGSEDDSASPSGGAVTPADLDGTTYLSTAVTGHELVTGTDVRLTFEAGTMSAAAGCNTMFGPFDVTSGTLAWTDLPASTLIGCADDLVAQDRWLTDLLVAGVEAELSGSDLTLTLGDVALDLASSTAVALQGALGRPWRVVGTVAGDQVTPIPEGVRNPRLSVRADGLASLDTGCNNGRTTVQVDGDTLLLGPSTVTRAACQEPAASVEQQVLAVLDGRSDLVTYDGAVLVVTKGDRGLVIEVG